MGDSKQEFRQRLLDGLTQAIVEQSFSNTSVADIVRNAGTSRRTFYEHFDSREDCFIELIRQANAQMITFIGGAIDDEAHWEVQVDQAITAWIEAAASQPSLMLSWIRDTPSLGERARQLQRETMEDFVALVRAVVSEGMQATQTDPPRERIIILLGGLRELIATTVEDGMDLSSIRTVAVEATKALAAQDLK